MSRQQPGSVTNAIRVLGGLVALSGLTALLTVVLRDELVRSWADGHATAREIMARGGLEALDKSSITPPAFVPVAIVLFFVFAALAGVLVMFFRDGHNWARLSLSALVVFMGMASLAALRTGPPTPFLVLSAVSIVLDLALLVCLWHKDTTAYIQGAWLASHPESSDSSGSSSSGSSGSSATPS